MLIYENNGNLSYNKIVVKEGFEKEFATMSEEASNIKEGRFFETDVIVRFDQDCTTSYVLSNYKRISGSEREKIFFNFDEKNAYTIAWGRYNKNEDSYSLIIKAPMNYPTITELFVRSSKLANFRASNILDLTGLFASEKEQLEIACILNMPNEIKKDILYKLHPAFACFYYEVLPIIDLKETELYPISEVKDLKTRTESLHISTAPIDEILSAEAIATKNTEVLKLVRKI